MTRGPLLTASTARDLLAAHAAGASSWRGSLDLSRSTDDVALGAQEWDWRGQRYPFPPPLKDRTVHYWAADSFVAAARYTDRLIKLVPTPWGPPTFEIDGIKMLPSAQVSPYDDARRKVALVEPRDRRVLDTCGGLGYFAACALESGAARIVSFEKNADVLWLRSLNPWSPDLDDSATRARLHLTHGDVLDNLPTLPDDSFDAVLHDPPRFGIAGELYSLTVYRQLARVLRRGGRLFHYTGSPNRLTSRRDVPGEVALRLQQAGFQTRLALDGVFATRR